MLPPAGKGHAHGRQHTPQALSRNGKRCQACFEPKCWESCRLVCQDRFLPRSVQQQPGFCRKGRAISCTHAVNSRPTPALQPGKVAPPWLHLAAGAGPGRGLFPARHTNNTQLTQQRGGAGGSASTAWLMNTEPKGLIQKNPTTPPEHHHLGVQGKGNSSDRTALTTRSDRVTVYSLRQEQRAPSSPRDWVGRPEVVCSPTSLSALAAAWSVSGLSTGA